MSSVGETTAGKSKGTVKRMILENHLLQSEHPTGWESRNGERDLKFMQRSLAREILYLQLAKYKSSAESSETKPCDTAH